MTFPTETDAGRWLSIVEADILRGVWRARPVETFTVRQWSERWLATVEPHLKRTTVATYRALLKGAIWPTFGNTELSQLRPIDIAEWLANLSARDKCSPSWVRKSYRLLSQILKAAVDNDVITSSPMRGHRLPRLPEPDPRILTREEVALLVSKAEKPFDLVILVLAYSGIRVGEMIGLRVGDISPDGARLTVARRHAEIGGLVDVDTPKAHQQRTITLPEFVAIRLATHRRARLRAAGKDAPLFVGKKGQGLRYTSWRDLYFDPYVEAAGLTGVTPHSLRASHGTWVADEHGVLVAASRLGHSNASVTTRHYARARKGHDAEVAASFSPVKPIARESHTEDQKASDLRSNDNLENH